MAGNQWRLMKINGGQWKSVEICGNQYESMEINVKGKISMDPIVTNIGEIT